MSPAAARALEEQIRFANEAFYAAFAAGDYAAMDALWASEAPVSCIHPGWPALTARGAVMESWRGILEAPPPISYVDVAVNGVSDRAGFVVCYEDVGGGFLVATNVFARENGGWRIVHHQAGPTSEAPKARPTPPTPPAPRIVN